MINCWCLNIVLYLLFQHMTPLHLSAKLGLTDVTKVLLEAGASLSAVDNHVIKPSVKLRQSNNKFFKGRMRNVV
jgi:hypothetical protein